LDKPKYEKDALIKGIEKRDQNIKAFEEGIQKEMIYKRELQGYLAEHEQYERLQNVS
jgi:hypothetical protein